MVGLGWWLDGAAAPSLSEYQQITFRTGSIGDARFTPMAASSTALPGTEANTSCIWLAPMTMARANSDLEECRSVSISKNGELAIRLNTVNLGGMRGRGRWPAFP